MLYLTLQFPYFSPSLTVNKKGFSLAYLHVWKSTNLWHDIGNPLFDFSKVQVETLDTIKEKLKIWSKSSIFSNLYLFMAFAAMLENAWRLKNKSSMGLNLRFLMGTYSHIDHAYSLWHKVFPWCQIASLSYKYLQWESVLDLASSNHNCMGLS